VELFIVIGRDGQDKTLCLWPLKTVCRGAGANMLTANHKLLHALLWR